MVPKAQIWQSNSPKMTWLPIISIALTFGAFLPATNGNAETKKMLFQNYELMVYFTQSLVNSLTDKGLIRIEQENEILNNFKELIEKNQGKKISTVKHAFASKVADIMVESLENTGDATAYIESARNAIVNAFEDSTGVVDTNFIETVTEMVSVMYNNDIEDEIEEEEEEVEKALAEQQQNLEQQLETQSTTESDEKTTTTQTENQVIEANENEEIINSQYDFEEAVDNKQIEENYNKLNQNELINNYAQNTESIDNSNSDISTYNLQDTATSMIQQENSVTTAQTDQNNIASNRLTEITAQSSDTQYGSLSSKSKASSTSQTVLVNYQSIQTSLSSSLQSSSVLSSLSSGIVSSQDMMSILINALSQVGVDSTITQRVTNQYLSSMSPGSSLQTYSNTISTIVTQVLQQSGIVRAGEESLVSQSVYENISRNLQSITSQRSRPAPAPRPQPAPRPVPRPSPAPIPVVRQPVPSYSASQLASSAQISAQTSAVQSAQTSSLSQASSDSFESSLVSEKRLGNSISAISKASSQLMSFDAVQRISSLSRSLSSAVSGGINYSGISDALASVTSKIVGKSGLSKSEAFIEALLETLIALLECISPSPSGINVAASTMAQALVRVME